MDQSKINVYTLGINVIGAFSVNRSAAAAMAQNHPDDDGQRGVIVNTSSLAGVGGQAGRLAYATAKASSPDYTTFSRDHRLDPYGST